MEKDHMEIILEDINSKFDLVLEGHATLNAKIDAFRDESNRKHEETTFLLKTLNVKIDAVADNLAAHRADTEAHGRYVVRED